jgi:hypothetical protein
MNVVSDISIRRIHAIGRKKEEPMDSFLHLTHEENDQNKKTNSNPHHVDKKRIQRLKKNFLPFWMREIADQEQKHNEASPKTNSAHMEPK